MRAYLMLSVAVGKKTHDNSPLLELPVLRSEVVVGFLDSCTTTFKPKRFRMLL
jgi:hypothetical protein